MAVKAGDRLEAKWIIAIDANKGISHWWGVTLLEHDGRTEDEVAIRTKQYDCFLEGGYVKPTNGDVVCLGREYLLDYTCLDKLSCRLQVNDASAAAWVDRNYLE